MFGDEISRYGRPTPKTHVIYLTRNSNLGDWPRAQEHLAPFKTKLSDFKFEVQHLAR